MSNILSFSGHVVKTQTMADKSVRIWLDTAKEMIDPNELAQLFTLSEEVVSIGVKVGQFKDEELLQLPEPKAEPGEKSQAERLKAVLFVWHKQMGGTLETWPNFYKGKTETLIQSIKDKLEPE